MSSELLPCLEIEPETQPATASVVWLHGLGADGNDFEPIVPELRLPTGHGVRFVFPHAPKIPVTLNFGMVMPAWYDIGELGERDSDEPGIRRSAASVEALIARERARGITSDRIVLAGFSQGGAIALHTALRHPEPLAGLLVLSAYLLLADKLGDEASDANRGIDILQCHGTHDPMVQERMGRQASETLRAGGWNVRYETYPMQHQVCLEEIELIGEWLTQRLGLGGGPA